MGSAADATQARFASLATIGAGLLVAGLVAVGLKSAQMAGDFQQAVNRLKTGAGDTTDSFNTLASGILKVSVATGLMSGPLTKAMYDILSSGQRGAQALDTLSAAAKGAVIEQANVTDVSDTLAGAMTNFGTKTFGAVAYMNGLITAVSRGRITLQDLSTAMGPIEPVAHAMGVSFADLSAAMSTQTNAAIPAARAATGLRFMMQSLEVPTTKAKDAMAAMGLSSVAVANEMKVSLPGALQMVYDAAKKAGPEGSQPFNQAVSDMVGGQRSLSTFLALTGTHMKDFSANAKAIADSMKGGAGEVSGWAIAQGNFNVQMDRAKASIAAAAINLGLLLLPALGRIVSVVPQIVTYLSNFSDHANVLVPILAGLGAAILSLLVPAVIALAVAVWNALWPVLAIGAAVAGLVAIFMHFYQTNAGFKGFIDNLVTGFRTLWSLIQANFMPTMQRLGAFFQGTILPALQQVGAFLVSTFKPAWEQLVQTWNTNLLPALKMLWGLFQTIWPVLKVVGEVIIGVVIVAFALVVVAIVLVIKWVALLIQGWGLLISFIGAAFSAIGTTITNIKNFVGRVFSDIGSIITIFKNTIIAHFNALKMQVGEIFNAIGTFIHDKLMWIYDHNKYVKAFVDIVVKTFTDFKNNVGAIFSALGTFIHDKLTWIKNTVGSIFDAIGTWMHDKATGAKNAVGGIFSQLGADVQSRLTNLKNNVGSIFDTIGTWMHDKMVGAWNKLVSFVSGWPSQAYQWGVNLIQGIINGIGSMFSALGNAASNAASQVWKFLGFSSPTKEGPGSTADTWMPNLMNMLKRGILAGTPDVQRALAGVLAPMSTSFAVNATGSLNTMSGGLSLAPMMASGGSVGVGGKQDIHVHVYLDGAPVAKKLMPHIVQQIRTATGVKF